MFSFKKKILIATHSGSFHTDDVFAAATLHLYLKKQKQSYALVRTTDEEVLKKSDIVFDIGGVYDPETNRFDHHQKSGAGQRENGIPYAAFGLVWKKYGPLLCESAEIAQEIDTYFVQAVDASDNGVDLFEKKFNDVSLNTLETLVGSFNISFDEDEHLIDERFNEIASFATRILERVIHQTKTQHVVNTRIKELYQEQGEGKLLVVDDMFGRFPIIIATQNFSDLLYFVYPGKRDGNWNVCAARVSEDSFESKKPFPESWRGLRGEDCAQETGVPGAVFCHNSGFLCATKTKEGALELAKKALSA